MRQFARECPWGRASVGRPTFIGNAGLNSAIEALQAIGAEPKRVVPALIAALEDDDRDVRVQAIRSLESIGPEAKQAVLALIEGFKRVDRRDRQFMLEALARIVPETERVVRSLVSATHGGRTTTRRIWTRRPRRS